MKIKLVFDDWRREGRSLDRSPENIELTKHDFHGGSTFDGTILIDVCQEEELREAIEKGYQPVFWITQ